VKVLDFGVAKARNQRTLTMPGIVKGKPLYMSPEQAAGERLDRRSDLFAVGLMLYEAVVGTRAFDRGDDTRSMESIVNDPLVRPAGVSDALWAVLEKACAKSPEARFRSAAEMAAALREGLSPLSTDELARLVSNRFPSRLSEYGHWERLADEWSRTTLKKVKAMPDAP
jgi:serine/threonine-protein kinase